MPEIIVDTGDALLNKTDKSLCPHGAYILVGRETINIPTSKTNRMSEGGKCFGAKRIRERLMTAHGSSSGSHRGLEDKTTWGRDLQEGKEQACGFLGEWSMQWKQMCAKTWKEGCSWCSH